MNGAVQVGEGSNLHRSGLDERDDGHGRVDERGGRGAGADKGGQGVVHADGAGGEMRVNDKYTTEKTHHPHMSCRTR